MSEKLKPCPLLRKKDNLDGYIFACPHCHRYVTCRAGIQTCSACGGVVDNDAKLDYGGRIIFDGEESWE